MIIPRRNQKWRPLEHVISTDPLEKIFDVLEDHKEELGTFYYSTSQPALDDVFLDVLTRNGDLKDVWSTSNLLS
jgi:hypothetical protein